MSSERVLIWLKPTYLGDAVMAAPLIDGMAQSVENLVVLAGPKVSQVLADRADKIEFLASPNLGNPLSLLRQAKELRRFKFDTVLLVNRSFRSALCARAAGIPRRIGHATEGRGFLLTSGEPYDLSRFEAECYLDLARAAGYPLPFEEPRLAVTADETAEGLGFLDGSTVGIQPGARYDSKRIPSAVLAEVLDRLRAVGKKVAFLGGKEELLHGEELLALTGPEGITSLIGTTDLRQTMGVLSSLELMIGSDTGLMHLAAGLGIPTVTVFGPNPMSKWGHDYPPHRPIQAPNGRIEQTNAAQILQAIDVYGSVGVRTHR